MEATGFGLARRTPQRSVGHGLPWEERVDTSIRTLGQGSRKRDGAWTNATIMLRAAIGKLAKSRHDSEAFLWHCAPIALEAQHTRWCKDWKGGAG